MRAILIFALLTITATGCVSPGRDFSWASPTERERLKAEVDSYRRLDSLIHRCNRSASTEVFEGLPHLMFERKALERESARSDTFVNHGYRFYSPAMQLPASAARRLIGLTKTASSYLVWRGPKYCGGFHPDLVVRFHRPEGVIDVHLCFGCREAQFYDGATTAHVDLREGVAYSLQKIQEEHRAKRPRRESSFGL